jgi:hypothetical protein
MTMEFEGKNAANAIVVKRIDILFADAAVE